MRELPLPSDGEVLAHDAWVRGLVRTLVRDRELADDVLQDVREAQLRRPEQVVNLRAWLGGLVRNSFRKQLRARRRREVLEGRVPTNDYAPSTAELVVRAEVLRTVSKAVLDLPDPYRAVLLLRYHERWPARKIASARESDVVTIDNQIRQGLRLLRPILEQRLGGNWMTALVPVAFPLKSAAASVATIAIMTKPIALTSALLIVALGIGISMTRSGLEHDIAPSPQVSVAAATESAGYEDDLDTVDDEDQKGDGVARRELVVAGEASRTEALALGARPVRVIDGETGRPVEGATVSWLGETTSSLGYSNLLLANELRLLEEEQDRRFTSDSSGRASLPWRGGGRLFAIHDGAFGFTSTVGLSVEDPAEVELNRPRSITVRVNDEDGAPVASTPVSVRVRFGNAAIEQFAANVNRDGALTLFDIGGEEEEGSRFVVVGGVLGDFLDAASAPIPAGNEPVELNLVLPMCGRVEVPVFDLAGHPARDGVRVQLARSSTARSSGAFRTDRMRMDVAEALTKDGIAVFPAVLVGGHFLHAAAFLYEGGSPSLAQGVGPAGASDVVTIPVHESAELPVLVGRVVDGDGTPTANREFTILLNGRFDGAMANAFEVHDSHSDSASIRTDADGVFRHEPNFLRGRTGFVALEFTLFTPPGEAALGVTILIEADWGRTGPYDLGDLMLGPTPIAVSGIVLDPKGSPVGGAMVDAGLHSDARTITDVAGRFLVPGNVFSGKREVRVEHPRFRPAIVPHEYGDDLIVRLEAGGILEGAVLVDEFVPFEELSCAVFPKSQSLDRTKANSAAVVDINPIDGSFRFERLAPGPSSLVFLFGDDQVLATLEDVEVSLDGPPDSRLAAVDLRGTVFRYQFEFQVAGGGVVPEVRVFRTDAKPWESYLTVEGSRCELLTSKSVLPLQITAGRTFHAIESTFSPGEHTVELIRGMEVTIRIAHPPFPDGVRMPIILYQKEKRGQREVFVPRARSSDFRGEETFTLTVAGEWKIFCGLQDGVAKWPKEIDLGSGRFTSFDVADTSRPQTIDFEVSSGTFEATLEALRQEP